MDKDTAIDMARCVAMEVVTHALIVYTARLDLVELHQHLTPREVFAAWAYALKDAYSVHEAMQHTPKHEEVA